MTSAGTTKDPKTKFKVGPIKILQTKGIFGMFKKADNANNSANYKLNKKLSEMQTKKLNLSTKKSSQ